jgi:hypothetical protein
VKLEELRDLLEDARGITRGAFIAYRDRRPGEFGVTWWEVVTIWVGLEVSKAVIDRLVGFAISWMQERFRNNPGRSDRPKAVRFVRYEGETGIAFEYVEIEYPDAKPVRRSPDPSELYTRKKPPIR